MAIMVSPGRCKLTDIGGDDRWIPTTHGIIDFHGPLVDVLYRSVFIGRVFPLVRYDPKARGKGELSKLAPTIEIALVDALLMSGAKLLELQEEEE
jgi:hypothetical protein